MTEPELEKTLAGARRAEPAWGPRRQQLLTWTVLKRVERPALRGRAWFVTGFAVAAAGVFVLAWGGPKTPPAAPLAKQATAAGGEATGRAPEGSTLTLADGSRIVLDSPTTVLRKTVEARNDVRFDLESGGAGFDVARRPSRTFRVQAGDVTVQVIGTKFHVERSAGHCQVKVERGRVLVSWWGGSREIGAGEAGTFPPITAPAGARLIATRESPREHRATSSRASYVHRARSPESEPAQAHVPALQARAVTSSSAGATGIAPAAVGANVTASASVTANPRTAPTPAATPAAEAGSRAGALFAAADRARVQGRPAEAASALRDLVRRYPRDAYAPAAYFTLGRLSLESLGEPRQAAVAFAQARQLAHGGAMAEDALAREVEALHAAGDATAARQRAQMYRDLYPQGLRLRSVTRLGGLQDDP